MLRANSFMRNYEGKVSERVVFKEGWSVIRGATGLFDSLEKCESVLGWPPDCSCVAKLLYAVIFLGLYKYDKCQTLHDGSTH